MEKNSWNQGWTVRPLGSEAAPQIVTLPHDAMLGEKRDASSAGGTNTGWFSGGDYVYEKRFVVPDAWLHRHVEIEFEGVYHRAEVTLNGHALPSSPNGYIGFTCDVDGLLNPGENVLRVIARNGDQPNSRWYTGTGIYRPVWIIVQPMQRILPQSIAIHTVEAQSRTMHITWQTTCRGDTRVTLLHGERILAEGTAREGHITLSAPEMALWSPENPALYTCRLAFGEDMHEVRFGVRSITCDAQQGFCINGKRTLLLGACIHHDNGMIGAVCHPDAERRKVRLLKEAGFNAIRSAHNPYAKALLDACDELGMLVVDEYADMWYIHKTQHDYADILPGRWQQDLTALVQKDRNHPSVVMYSIGNEVAETAQKRGIDLTEQMVRHLHQLDDRPVTCGVNCFFNFLSSMGFGVYSDKKAWKDAKRAGKGRKRAVGSEFFNKLSGLMGADFMKWGATLHGSDWKTRDAFAKMDVAGYNYGVMRYRSDLRRYPKRVILGSETFCADAAAFYDLAREHPALIGDFVWTGLDHLGEVGLGAWEYTDYAPAFDHGPGWLTSGCGCLDLTGKPDGQMGYMQVAYGQRPIAMAVVPPMHARKRHSPSAWRMSNARESWAWNGCEGKTAQVEVSARAHEVQLLLNGKPVGRRRVSRKYRAIFRIPWQPGTLTAIALDANGAEQARTSLCSAGEETRLRMKPERETVAPEELCYVHLQYTDERGTVKPTVRGRIRVEVAGGTLLALGHACPYNADGYLRADTDTYYGTAMAVIRPNGAGSVRIEAESPWGSTQVIIPGNPHVPHQSRSVR